MKAHRPLTRRSFLKTAIAAGAAPLVLRSSLFAADATPDGQVTLGCIGIGAQGFGLLNNCLGRREFRVLAVCDVDTTRRNLGKQTVDD
ncbi:MAG TPA: twin-arginine translocation signal domain-containing protein, partial [Verrucomicrobiae bacterium]|nr:twin-arginine translocation signal domain-containing protein [Verrucomicrobiae bacterium]